MLAEQAGDVLPLRRKAVVHRGWDQHLNNRLFRPSIAFGIKEGLIHIIQRRRYDDTRLVMLTGFGQAGEFRQFGQSNIHAECAAASLETPHTPFEFGFQIAIIKHAFVKDFWANIGDDTVGSDLFAAFQAHTRNFFTVNQYTRHRRL